MAENLCSDAPKRHSISSSYEMITHSDLESPLISQINICDDSKVNPKRRNTSSSSAISSQFQAIPESFNKALASKVSFQHDLDFSQTAVPDTHIWHEAPKDELINVPPHYLDTTSDRSSISSLSKHLRVQCAACHICISSANINNLIFRCKPTFIQSIAISPRPISFKHHLVEVKHLNSKCFLCKKPLNPAHYELRCSWCHYTYHKECFNPNATPDQRQVCSFGVHSKIILPPTLLAKSPNSLPEVPVFDDSATENFCKVFKILSPPDTLLRLQKLVVFVNSKSGGGQGQLILHQMLWLLNPRQVFDITLGGPKYGLSLFKGSNFRILCCGGDGTAGWINSVIEELGFDIKPPMSVLPLGTGNDLARVLGGGSGYDNSSLTRILNKAETSTMVELDRWTVSVHPTPPPNYEPTPDSCNDVPISTMNNYFSVGSDANAALEFHNYREKSTGKAQSRILNKLVYLRAGSNELIKRSFSNMADYINLKCDGIDFTDSIRKRSYVAVVVLNIPSYGAGTTPWGKPNLELFKPQKFDDGIFEVFCITQLQLSKLYLGGTGERICQAKHVELDLLKALPVQVDGEPCLLNPCKISITHKTRALMIANLKDISQVCSPLTTNTAALFNSDSALVKFALMKVLLSNDDADLLKKAVNLGVLNSKNTTTLSEFRAQIFLHAANLLKTPIALKLNPHANLSPNWSYLGLIPNRDNEFYQVLPYQEDQMCVQDIANPSCGASSVFILETEYNDIRLPDAPRKSLIPQLSLQDISPSHSSDSLNIHNDSPEPTFDTDDSTPLIQDSEDAATHELVFREDSFPLHVGQNFLSESQHESFTMVKQGNLPEIKKLMTTNEHLMKPTPKNMTALHVSSRYGHKLMTQFLLEHFPKHMLNMQETSTGQTALHRAAIHGHTSVCKMLVQAGADLSIKDNSYNTAYDLSVYYGDNALRDYLWTHTYQDLYIV